MSKTLTINRDLLVTLIKRIMDGHVKYKLGAKCAIDADSSSIKEIDCSGFVRWLLYRISGYDIGDGSWNQRTNCIKAGFKPCPYSDCSKLDGKLRIAFIKPKDGKAGHVWLVANGNTIESYGRIGPGRRAWNNRTLKSNVYACYVLSGDM